jgi:hypothetical protein
VDLLGVASDFTDPTGGSPRVSSNPHLAPLIGRDQRKPSADSPGRHRASPPVPPRPAQPSVGRRESGGKFGPPSDQSSAPNLRGEQGGVRVGGANAPKTNACALWLRRGGGLRRGSCARAAASARSAATHWCHSRECHERLPPSPALSRSMAGLKKRLFLYGPAHRAQMLAKAQGGRSLALRKVGAELYLGA